MLRRAEADNAVSEAVYQNDTEWEFCLDALADPTNARFAEPSAGYVSIVPSVDSVNVGRARPNPYKHVQSTGIEKVPQQGPVSVRSPGSKEGGEGSGLVGDYVGDRRNHGGDRQAVYAFQREDLDTWAQALRRPFGNGSFGENVTTRGIDVNDARIGEQWRLGAEVVLQVTGPRIPCSTFRGWMGVKNWLKIFSAQARPGAYLAVVSPGQIRAGDLIEVISTPDHDVSVSDVFRALILDHARLPGLVSAGDDLGPEILAAARAKASPFDEL
jgi:MOSC domain-containing protein YiiM